MQECDENLKVITIAVLYNVFFVIARSVFWVMTSKVWMVFDYTADVIYLVDLFVRCQRIPDTSVMLETLVLLERKNPPKGLNSASFAQDARGLP